jgi:hypothetical protein
LIQDCHLVFSQREIELLVAHAQALAGYLANDPRGSSKSRIVSYERGERSNSHILVGHFVQQNFSEYTGNFPFKAVFLQLAAHPVEGTASTLRQGDGGAFEFFVLSADFFRFDGAVAVQKRGQTFGVSCPYFC